MIYGSKRKHLKNSCILGVQALEEAGTLDPTEPDNEARDLRGLWACLRILES